MAFESRIDIRVVRFRPIGSVTTTTVEMALNAGSSSPDQEGVNDRGVVRLVGSYFIKVKQPGSHHDDNAQEMRIKFTVSPHEDNPNKDTEHYMLQGVAFSNRDQTAPADPAMDNRDYFEVAGKNADNRAIALFPEWGVAPCRIFSLVLNQRPRVEDVSRRRTLVGRAGEACGRPPESEGADGEMGRTRRKREVGNSAPLDLTSRGWRQ